MRYEWRAGMPWECWLSVEQYIRNTFNAAKDSMSINGMDSKEMDAELAKAQEGEGTRSHTRKWHNKLLTSVAQRLNPSTPNSRKRYNRSPHRSRTKHSTWRTCAEQRRPRHHSVSRIRSQSRQNRTMRDYGRMRRRSSQRPGTRRWTLARLSVWTRFKVHGRTARRISWR